MSFVDDELDLRNEWLNYNHSNIKLPSYCYWTYHSIHIQTNNERINYWNDIINQNNFKIWNKKKLVINLITKLSQN